MAFSCKNKQLFGKKNVKGVLNSYNGDKRIESLLNKIYKELDRIREGEKKVTVKSSRGLYVTSLCEKMVQALVDSR